MFASSKPVVFDPYRRQRRRGIGLPGWAWLLLAGLAAGAGGVLYLQAEVLPPRLSGAESAALLQRADQSRDEAARLQAELAQARQKLQAATGAQQRSAEEAAAARQAAEALRDDLAALIAVLPPDPRDGAVAVRVGRFSTSEGKLDYDLVLTRDRAGARPLQGVLQLVVAGQAAGGRETAVRLQPVALTLGAHEVVRGSAALPEGFTPQRTTIQVLDRPAGKSLGMRVLPVR